MSRCKAINPVSLKRCVRGAAHVASGLAHDDGHGTYWAAPELSKLSPDEEFEQRIREAVAIRLNRMKDRSAWTRDAMYDDLSRKASGSIRRMHDEWRRAPRI